MKQTTKIIVILALIVIITNLAITNWLKNRSRGYAPDYDISDSALIAQTHLSGGHIPDSEMFFAGDTLIFEGIKYAPVK